MAYCRWSSDNWKSDVYVYESDAGIEIYTAGMRYVGEAPEGDYFKASYAIQLRNWLDETEMVPIGGPSDSQSYICDREDALSVLDRLRSEGYHVPQYAIDDIRAELEEYGNE